MTERAYPTSRHSELCCSGGWSLDAFDVQMYSFVIPTVISLWGLSRGEAHIVFPFLGVQLSQPPNHALAP
jgi:hypothetical protein